MAEMRATQANDDSGCAALAADNSAVNILIANPFFRSDQAAHFGSASVLASPTPKTENRPRPEKANVIKR